MGTLAAVMKQVQAAAFLLGFASLMQHFPSGDLRSSASRWLGSSCIGQCHCSEVSMPYNSIGLKGKSGHDAVKRQCWCFLFFSHCGGSPGMSGSSFPTTTWAGLCRCCGHEHLKDQSTSSSKMYSSMKAPVICC